MQSPVGTRAATVGDRIGVFDTDITLVLANESATPAVVSHEVAGEPSDGANRKVPFGFNRERRFATVEQQLHVGRIGGSKPGSSQWAAPCPSSPWRWQATSEAEAVARAVIAMWFPNPVVQTIPGTTSLVDHVEGQHGGPIQWDALELARRGVYFAESHSTQYPRRLGPPSNVRSPIHRAPLRQR